MALAVYDLRCAPITFDFCNFIAMAHMRALARGEHQFDLVIRADSFRNVTPREKSYSLTEREWRLRNLLLEVWKITRSCRNLVVTRDPQFQLDQPNLFPEYDPIRRDSVPYLLTHSRSVYLQTKAPPIAFGPTDSARAAARQLVSSDLRLVTVTLRRASFDTARNSNVEQWEAAATTLRERGINLVVLPDQDDCLGERALFAKSWSVCEAAAFSLDLRLAIMERAELNLVSSGGMGAPAWYSEINYTMFNILHDGHYVANVDYFRRAAGLEVGNNFLWALPNQNLEWTLTEPGPLLEKYLKD
jgi:hypothetical protein